MTDDYGRPDEEQNPSSSSGRGSGAGSSDHPDAERDSEFVPLTLAQLADWQARDRIEGRRRSRAEAQLAAEARESARHAKGASEDPHDSDPSPIDAAGVEAITRFFDYLGSVFDGSFRRRTESGLAAGGSVRELGDLARKVRPILGSVPDQRGLVSERRDRPGDGDVRSTVGPGSAHLQDPRLGRMELRSDRRDHLDHSVRLNRPCQATWSLPGSPRWFCVLGEHGDSPHYFRTAEQEGLDDD